jgi:precorrin-2 methylase
MDWSALVGGLIGAGIPAVLAYLGLHRARQSADAEVFGPAVLLLDRLNPDRVTMNLNPDATAEAARWAELQRQLDLARERLLIVSAGHPRRRLRRLAQDAQVKIANAFQASNWAVRDLQANKDNPEWMDHARKTHAEAMAAMRDLIDANFGWSVFGRPLMRTKSDSPTGRLT